MDMWTIIAFAFFYIYISWSVLQLSYRYLFGRVDMTCFTFVVDGIICFYLPYLVLQRSCLTFSISCVMSFVITTLDLY